MAGAPRMPLPLPNPLLYLRLIMYRVRAALSLTLWIALIGMAVVGLHSLGNDLPTTAIWSSSSTVESAMGAAARLLGLAAGYWLLVSTLVYLLGRVMRLPAAVRSVDWATLPWARRLADRISTRALVRALAAPLPLLDLVTPGYVPVPAGDPPPPATTTTVVIETPAIETPVETPVPVTPAVPTVATPAVPPANETLEAIVRDGDNMWKLAEARLRNLTGRSPTDAEIAPYWRRVVESNRDRIRSGDPDLIFPGEVLILPAV